MVSILSNSQVQRNNTMTLMKGGRGGLSSLGPNTTLYGEESLVENGEIEELHYLMVRVEKMKKTMLNKVEGRSQSVIEKIEQTKSGKIRDENDVKEELLYRVNDENDAKLLEIAFGSTEMSQHSRTERTKEFKSDQNKLASNVFVVE